MKKFTNSFLAFLFSLAASSSSTAQTYVSGSILSNTTWTKVNSPYIVTDTVVVFPGVTLTIEPGVTVKFADNQLLEIRQATIVALGTSTDSITFTSNSSSPHRGIWQEIDMHTALSIQIDYCIFKYSLWGLYSFHSKTLQHLAFYDNFYCLNYATIDTLRLSSFYNNESGCGAKIGIIDSCTFIKNNIGIDNDGSIVTSYTNCTFIGDTTAISFFDAGHIAINNCIFTGNLTAINVSSSGGGGPILVTNCIFCNNGSCYQDYGGIFTSNTILHCNFSHNHVACIRGDFIGCIFTNNDTAVDHGELISDNYVYHNHVGVLSSLDSTSSNNHVCNNTLYNLVYTGTSNSRITNICWCDIDSAAIRSKIYDGYVNAAYGFVNFSPYTNCDSSSITSLPPINCQTVVFASIDDPILNNNSEIEIFPNPTTDYLTVVLSKNNRLGKLKIFSMLGELKYCSSAISTEQATIDVSSFANGIYVLEVATDEGISRQKFIKQDGNR